MKRGFSSTNRGHGCPNFHKRIEWPTKCKSLSLDRKSTNPVLVLLASHWLSMTGAALVTSAALGWFIVVLAPGRRAAGNAYLGILTVFVLPAVFFVGLALMPIGAWLAKKRIRNAIGAVPLERGAALRRLLILLGVTTLANLMLATQFTYRAVEQMETIGFCGGSCHVMQPEFRAYQVARHNKVACVECHVAPGAAGWLTAKTSGTRQLYEVITNSHPRPIPSAMESDRLTPAIETCERCHSRSNAAAPRVRILRKYGDDERNTPAYTVMMVRTGKIHGAHLDADVDIEYTASDAKRQTIPVVQWRNRRTGESREYRAKAFDGKSGGTRFVMQCVDCHNRPAHTFELPERAVDEAIAAGEITPTLPSVKKNATALLKAIYPARAAAEAAIQTAFRTQYSGRPEAGRAATAVSAIYARNVFPDLKVTWGTYPNNLGHTDFPGCFRCHDGEHATNDGKSIGQDCSSCHEMLAVEEADPEILKKLKLTQGESK